MIGAYILPLVFCLFFFRHLDLSFSLILLVIIVSTVSQIGDLFVSYLKRKAKIKDTGNFLPGHGGLLDRMDSIFPLIIFVSIIKLLDYNFFFIV